MTEKGQTQSANDKRQEQILKRLDMIVVILLANQGLSQGEIAKILGVSTKTIERMFAGSFNKIQNNEK